MEIAVNLWEWMCVCTIAGIAVVASVLYIAWAVYKELRDGGL